MEKRVVLSAGESGSERASALVPVH